MSQSEFPPESADEQLIHHVLVCQQCQSAIGPTGDCSYGCVHDMVYAKKRPRGSVRVRTYQLTLISEATL